MKVTGRSQAARLAMRVAKSQGMRGAKARPHQLQLFAKLDATASEYRLSLHDADVKKITGGQAGMGLLDRDGFIAVAIALGFVPVPVVGGVEQFTAAAPVFWPDPNVFDVAGAAGALSEAQQLEAFYWGKHDFKTNQDIRFDGNPNLPLRVVQQTQASGTTANMQTGMELQEIGAPVRFAGGDENEIIITIKAKDKTLIEGPATRNNYLVVLLEGAIIKGSTTKAYLNR